MAAWANLCRAFGDALASFFVDFEATWAVIISSEACALTSAEVHPSAIGAENVGALAPAPVLIEHVRWKAVDATLALALL